LQQVTEPQPLEAARIQSRKNDLSQSRKERQEDKSSSFAAFARHPSFTVSESRKAPGDASTGVIGAWLTPLLPGRVEK
jgi:hypothetical protein